MTMSEEHQARAKDPARAVEDVALAAFEEAKTRVMAGQEVFRTFVAMTAEGRIHIIVAPSAGYDDEPKVVEALRIAFVVWGVTAYAMVSEVWKSTDLYYDSSSEDRRPEHDPNRGEALMIVGCARKIDGANPMAVHRIAECVITRDPLRLGDMKWSDMTSVSGRFATLLPPPGMPPVPEGLREAIEKALASAGMPARMMPIEQYTAEVATKH